MARFLCRVRLVQVDRLLRHNLSRSVTGYELRTNRARACSDASLHSGEGGRRCSYLAAVPCPDTAGHGMQAPMEPTYDVRFRSRDLWLDSCDDALNHVGVFQSYLEKVEGA